MSQDWFSKLKEIDSLNKMRSICQQRMKDQDDRVLKLLSRRDQGLEQTGKLKQDLSSANTLLSELEAKLRETSEQHQRLLDYGGDTTKISWYKNECERLEFEGLELLNTIEQLERDILDVKAFQLGLEKTISEIEEEVRLEQKTHQDEITNIDFRLKLLMEVLPDSFRSLLDKTTRKNLMHGPFTRVDQGSCFFCRFKISRIDESEIDIHKNLKTCPQCSRIFLPYGA